MRHSSVRSFPSVVSSIVGACLLTGGLAAAAAGAPSDPTSPRPPARATALGTVEGTDGVPQTSDGVAGRIAAPLSTYARSSTRTSIRSMWTVAPGVRGVVWDETGPRGPVRAYLLSIKYRKKGLRLDVATNGAVRNGGTVRGMMSRDRAIAGVNGDFYDIGDTDAPLGVAKDRDRGLLNGRLDGWNSAFSISRSGRPDIGTLAVHTRLKQRPGLRIQRINSPSVAPGGIGAYTKAWGLTAGYRITDGQRRHVRAVMIRGGKVVANTTRLPSGSRIRGQMLVGRGPGASQLASMRVGSRASVVSRVDSSPAMAITGNQMLVNDGVIRVVDDQEMHPRTAIGIDRDTREILLLVVDGRQKFSRGYTMVEMADKMIALGADEALNLDGGGSSTMVAKRNGTIGVINSPSDGFERSVANGVELTYRRK